MKIIIGTCGKNERNQVYWVAGRYIIIPSMNVRIFTDTWEKSEVFAICRRNLYNFIEI